MSSQSPQGPTVAEPASSRRVVVDGKFFALGGERFAFRGVTYGTFRPRGDGALFPERDRLKLDLADMADAGFTVVRTYTAPPDHLLHLAGDRPLVLGETGLDAGTTPAGEEAQAQVLGWQLAVALERGVAGTCAFSWTDEWAVGGRAVEGWHFGLTRQDRSPRPALR